VQGCICCRIQTWVLRRCVDVTQQVCLLARTCRISSAWTMTSSALASNFIISRCTAVLCCDISTLHMYILDWPWIFWAYVMTHFWLAGESVSVVISIEFENCVKVLCSLKLSFAFLWHYQLCRHCPPCDRLHPRFVGRTLTCWLIIKDI